MCADRLFGGSALSRLNVGARRARPRVHSAVRAYLRAGVPARPSARDFATRYSDGDRQNFRRVSGVRIAAINSHSLWRVLWSRAQTDCDGVPFSAADSRQIIEARVLARTELAGHAGRTLTFRRRAQATWRHAVVFHWRAGDVLILDNVDVMHARMPSYSPPGERVILTALANPYTI